MKTTRRQFLSAAAAAPILSPIILGAQDKAGTKAPVLGSGRYTYEAIHDWGQLPSSIRLGNTHGVVEDSNGNIYVHHTVHATSESADSMVVFDRSGKFVRSWGKEYRGVAHGLHIRKEGRDEYLYLTVNAANPKMTPQPESAGRRAEGDDERGDRLEDPGAAGRGRLQARPGWCSEALQPDQHRDRAERRRLRRRRLRLVLRQPVQQQGGIHPDLRRPRVRSGTAGRTARHLGGYATVAARARGRRPRQQPAAALHARWQAHRFHHRRPPCPVTSTSTMERSWCRTCTAG